MALSSKKTPLSELPDPASINSAYMQQRTGNIFQRWFDSGKLDVQNANIANANDRAFQREMFDKQSTFNAAEAQKNRDFEERMSNTAYSRAASQLRELGINPYLLASGGVQASSTPSGSVASASAGSAYSRAASSRSNRPTGSNPVSQTIGQALSFGQQALSAYGYAMHLGLI